MFEVIKYLSVIVSGSVLGISDIKVKKTGFHCMGGNGKETSKITVHYKQ